MLQLNNIRLHADISDGFDHVFNPGEISVVLGSNQSGKTDLCRLIAGLNTPAEGEVTLHGKTLSALKPQQRPVSLVYQAFVNYPNLTVRENIASPLVGRRLSAATQAANVAELAAMLQISELLDRLPHELSGGQQQRLAIARALAKDADVLLLDEPLANLDFKLRESLEDEFRELLRKSNLIVIYTSSDPRDSFTLGDQVLLLDSGRKIQSGLPIDVYRNPNSFVAMELLADPFINRFESNGSSCALRPEHINLGKQNGAEFLNFEMHVAAYETNGDESYIHGQVRSESWAIRSHGMQDLVADSKIPIHARQTDVVRF